MTQDLSNYCQCRTDLLRCLCYTDNHYSGFPKLYFRDPNTRQFESVANGGELRRQSMSFEVELNTCPGLLAYYQNRGTQDKANGGPGLKAFPPGFRMVTGNPLKRSARYVA